MYSFVTLVLGVSLFRLAEDSATSIEVCTWLLFKVKAKSLVLMILKQSHRNLYIRVLSTINDMQACHVHMNTCGLINCDYHNYVICILNMFCGKTVLEQSKHWALLIIATLPQYRYFYIITVTGEPKNITCQHGFITCGIYLLNNNISKKPTECHAFIELRFVTIDSND